MSWKQKLVFGTALLATVAFAAVRWRRETAVPPEP